MLYITKLGDIYKADRGIRVEVLRDGFIKILKKDSGSSILFLNREAFDKNLPTNPFFSYVEVPVAK